MQAEILSRLAEEPADYLSASILMDAVPGLASLLPDELEALGSAVRNRTSFVLDVDTQGVLRGIGRVKNPTKQ